MIRPKPWATNPTSFVESLEKVPLGLNTPILLASLSNFASIDLVADKLCSWCEGLALEFQGFKEGPLVAGEFEQGEFEIEPKCGQPAVSACTWLHTELEKVV